jgi:alkaline phosphatase
LIVTADHETGHLQPIGEFTEQDVITNQCWGVNCRGWGSHTNSLVPVFAHGRGARWLKARHDGDYRDNTDIFKVTDALVRRYWFIR